MDRALAAAFVAGSTEPRFRLRSFSQHVVPWLVAAAGFWYVCRDLNPNEIGAQLSHLQWGWAAAAIILDVLSYVLQGARWNVLLAPLGRLSTVRATQAIYVGLFANEILPLRAGEVIRGFLAARWMRVAPIRVVPSMIAERLLDGAWLAVGIAVAVRTVALPPLLERSVHIFFFVLVTAVVLFCAYKIRSGHCEPGWTSVLAAALSGGILLAQALSYWFAMRSCGLEAGFWAGSAALVILRLGTLIPGAPANIGTYQFFCVLGLTLVGVARTAAASFSIVVFVMLTLPLWALGLVSLAGTGQSLYQLREGAAHE
jgi:uncharacterized membrane protein YbhN (UPF0104 family)